MEPRLFTPQQANKVLPTVRQRLDDVKRTLNALRETRDQLADLRIVWGDRLLEPTCPDRAEYESYRGRFVELEAELAQRIARVTSLGCEVKDPDEGLVDFLARRGTELVYLCWKRGEPRVGYWHTRAAGYAGRRPLDAF